MGDGLGGGPSFWRSIIYHKRLRTTYTILVTHDLSHSSGITREMPLNISQTLRFGTFIVTPQVFHLTPLSFALVNLKPLLPGHVLVCPQRVVPRFSELRADEVTDLFMTVQRVARMLERTFKADAHNIAIQDGVAAGQSVPHVHVHVIPRQKGDMDKRGGKDAIYDELEGEAGDVGSHQAQRQNGSFPRPDEGDRQPRSMEEMQREAQWLADEMEKIS